MTINFSVRPKSSRISLVTCFLIIFFVPQLSRSEVSIDSLFRKKVLPNGFTYYFIKKDPEKKGLVRLSLTIKAGFNEELPNQLEASHMIEHLAFKRTKNFSNALEHFSLKGLADLDIGGTTNSNRTEYFIKIPKSNEKLMVEGLNFLSECASSINVDKDLIDIERKVIANEIETKFNSSFDFASQVDKMLRKTGDNYRAFIDTRISVKNLEYDNVLNYYKTWYRPKNQALVVIGDFDFEVMEKLVIQLFGKLQNVDPDSNVILEDLINPYIINNNFIVVQDKGTTDINLRLIQKYQHKDRYGLPSQKDEVLVDLFNILIKDRLNNSNSNNKNSSIDFDPIGGLYNGYLNFLRIDINSQKDDLESDFKRVYLELQRVLRYNFSEFEFENAKQKLLSRYNYQRETQTNLWFIAMSNFVNGHPMIFQDEKKQNQNKILTSVIREDLYREFSKWVRNETDIDIIIGAGKGQYDKLLDRDKILIWMNQVKSQQIENIDDVPRQSVEKNLEDADELDKIPLSRFDKTNYPKLGLTKLVLANGTPVFIKSMGTSIDENILIHLFKPINTKLDNEAAAYFLMNKITDENGLGNLNNTELAAYYKRNRISVSSYSSKLIHGIYIQFPIANTKIAFQVINRLFHQKIDTNLSSKLSRIIDAFSNNKSSTTFPPPSISETLKREKYGNYIPNENELRSVDLDIVKSVFKDTFGDISGYNVVIAGAVDDDQVVKFTQKYIGSLKSTPPKKSIKEGLRQTVKVNEFNHPIDNKTENDSLATYSVSFFRYSDLYDINNKTKTTLDLLSKYVKYELYEELRIKRGLVYSVSSNVSHEQIQKRKGYYDFGITAQTLSCDMSLIDSLILKVISDINKNNITEDKIAGIKASYKSDIKKDVIDNKYIFSQYLLNQIVNKEPVDEIEDLMHQIDSITISDIKLAAKRYLKTENMSKYTKIAIKNCN